MSALYSHSAQPRLVVFDFDGTLAANKQPLEHLMAVKLGQLLDRTPFAVISTGDLAHLLKAVVVRLPESANLANLYLLPLSGSALYRYAEGGWDKVYEETLNEQDRATALQALQESAEATGFVDLAEDAWGGRIALHSTHIAFHALGADAPFSERYGWDADGAKARTLVEAIQVRLPERCQAHCDGPALFVISKAGINRAYGVRQLCLRARIAENDTLYIGDELYPGGIDEPLLDTNAQVLAVQSPADTARAIVSLLASS